MADVIRKDIEACVHNECDSAEAKFGLIHNDHERWALMMEEFEESCECAKNIKELMEKMWSEIRINNTESIDKCVENVHDWAIAMAIEACQLAAMCEKRTMPHDLGVDLAHGTYRGDMNDRV